MTTPTEAEIRLALEQRRPASVDTDDRITRMLDPLDDSDMARVRAGWDEEFHPAKGHPGTLWADLRPSETAELKELIWGVVREEEETMIQAIIDGVVAAATGFAERHPDIPRGYWPNGWTDPDEPAAGPVDEAVPA